MMTPICAGKILVQENIAPVVGYVHLVHIFKRMLTWHGTSRNREGDNDNGPRMVRFCACVICFKIDSQKTQCLLIALNKMQLLKKIILYVEVIF